MSKSTKTKINAKAKKKRPGKVVLGDSVDAEDNIDAEIEQEEAFPTPEPISYFGTDFDVHGLVRRLNAKDIVIPSFDPTSETDLAGFQRKFVWKALQQNRFIESLLLGFPVPGIFLVQQADRKLLVLDGQQRLTTLQLFYGNHLILAGVADGLVGKTYTTLDEGARRTLDNTFIHATVVKYDAEQKGDQSVYQLFERLNAGGTSLYPHEIRVSLYNGALVELIRDLNGNTDWRNLFGEPSPRLKDHELILRFLAFYYNADAYASPLKGFLNRFLKAHRELEDLSATSIRKLFAGTAAAINAGIGRDAFRVGSAVNAALVDAVMVGIARRLGSGGIGNPAKLAVAYKKLIADPSFLAAIGRATANEDRVKLRLAMATTAFAKV